MDIKWLEYFKARQISVQQYMIYYGPITPKVLAGLKTYDMVIIEPQQITKEQVQELQLSETIVIGYLSLIESPVWNKKRMAAIEKWDYYLYKGNRIHLSEWDSYVMDIRNEHYIDVIMDEIVEQIRGKGINGIFIDTVGDIEEHIVDPVDANQMLGSYLDFLSKIKSFYPELYLIQNRGFYVVEWSAPYLDGFLWENWQPRTADDVWVKQQVKVLKKLKTTGLQLFSVTCNSFTTKKRDSKPAGFIHLTRVGNYTEWPDH